MKATRKGLLVLIVLTLALTQATADAPLPPNPHQFLNEASSCDECHTYNSGDLDPHEFFVAIPEKCWECHKQKDLGRSHPIGIDPRHSPEGTVEVPEELPLEDGKVSCGSCHNPHLAFLSETRAYRKEISFFIQTGAKAGIPLYKTYYLRKSDPILGFEPLCLACHMDF